MLAVVVVVPIYVPKRVYMVDVAPWNKSLTVPEPHCSESQYSIAMELLSTPFEEGVTSLSTDLAESWVVVIVEASKFPPYIVPYKSVSEPVA